LVGLRLVDLGNYVKSGNTNGIAVITQLRRITVVFPVAHSNNSTKCAARKSFQMYQRASSFDIDGWAPSHDKSIELFSRASVPPAIISKDDRKWNQVLPPIVRREHIDDGALLGRRRVIPFRFRHSQHPPRGLKRLAWSQSPHIGVTRSFCQKRAETKARL
jgi:hypothetical protein